MKTTRGTAAAAGAAGDAANVAGANRPTASNAAIQGALNRLTRRALSVWEPQRTTAASRRPYPTTINCPLSPDAGGARKHRPAYHRAHAQPPGRGDQSLSPAARQQPGRLVPVGPRRARAREVARPADLPLDR